MSEERPHAITPPEPQPVTNLADPRAIQILSTEHWSLLATRSLVYNEAFTRGGMFLSFLSMSFVALALLAQAMAFGDQFLAVAAILLAFDLVIGLTTYGRIMGANEDDLRTVHGMARIRHGYTEIAPTVTRYLTTPIHDDVDALMMVYGSPSSSGLGVILYGLTTSGRHDRAHHLDGRRRAHRCPGPDVRGGRRSGLDRRWRRRAGLRHAGPPHDWQGRAHPGRDAGAVSVTGDIVRFGDAKMRGKWLA
ncbi:MAG: hypothetical protein ABR593_09255, partial [Candidatus Limnocylindria bacterium]